MSVGGLNFSTRFRRSFFIWLYLFDQEQYPGPCQLIIEFIMMKCFFSYSRTDAEFVLKLAKDLKQKGLDVWLDQIDIQPGSRWDASVEMALNDSECMLVVLSDASVKSENVLDEVSYAIKKGKKVIPLLIDNCEVPFRIARFQQIDFTKNYDAGLSLLTRTLQSGSRNEMINDPMGNGNDPTPRKRNLKPIIYFFLVLAIIMVAWYVISDQSQTTTEYSDNAIPADTAATIQIDDNSSIPTPINDTKTQVEEPDSPANTNTKPRTKIDPSKVLPLNPGRLVPVVTKNPIVDDGKNKILYKIANNNLLLVITSAASPSIQFDVNQNSSIDANYDRAYGITRDKKICVQFIIRSGASSGCGAAPSEASLSIIRNTYNFTIPIKEIVRAGRSVRDGISTTVSVQFQFTDLKNMQRTFYPTRSDYVDFTKVYKIKISQ